MAKNNLFRKSLIIGAIVLFISMSVSPVISSMNIGTKGNDTDTTDIAQLSVPNPSLGKVTRKIFFIGTISNLSVEDGCYSFRSVNLVKIEYWRCHASWGITYERYRRGYSLWIWLLLWEVRGIINHILYVPFLNKPNYRSKLSMLMAYSI